MDKLKYLRFHRLFSEKSLDELAQAANISRSKLSRAERGFAELNENEKELIAKALNVRVEALFPEEEK